MMIQFTFDPVAGMRRVPSRTVGGRRFDGLAPPRPYAHAAPSVARRTSADPHAPRRDRAPGSAWRGAGGAARRIENALATVALAGLFALVTLASGEAVRVLVAARDGHSTPVQANAARPVATPGSASAGRANAGSPPPGIGTAS